MTDEQIRALGPAFAGELRRYRSCFGQDRTAKHFDTYCRGLLSDLPRKTVEPIALAAGTAVRTLQEFLVTSRENLDSCAFTRSNNSCLSVSSARTVASEKQTPIANVHQAMRATTYCLTLTVTGFLNRAGPLINDSSYF